MPDYAKAFLKDWERLSMSGRYDMNSLKGAMLLLIANNAPLAPEWLDHPLSGDWAGHRECHIGGNFLLIYRIGQDARTGMIVLSASALIQNFSDRRGQVSTLVCGLYRFARPSPLALRRNWRQRLCIFGRDSLFNGRLNSQPRWDRLRLFLFRRPDRFLLRRLRRVHDLGLCGL
ncbi:MAG: type II toxin-antitoxin system YafQ family toxin [Synergistaceae bacterium]|nr:type II toxin-antitoxin system YafQ family toxin [Synergistaceae bacterium]